MLVNWFTSRATPSKISFDRPRGSGSRTPFPCSSSLAPLMTAARRRSMASSRSQFASRAGSDRQPAPRCEPPKADTLPGNWSFDSCRGFCFLLGSRGCASARVSRHRFSEAGVARQDRVSPGAGKPLVRLKMIIDRRMNDARGASWRGFLVVAEDGKARLRHVWSPIASPKIEDKRGSLPPSRHVLGAPLARRCDTDGRGWQRCMREQPQPGAKIPALRAQREKKRKACLQRSRVGP